MAWSHIQSTSQNAGGSAEQAEKSELTKYDYLLNNCYFVPVANETFGSWGQLGLKFIQDLGTRIADRTGEKRSASFLFQSISIATQRGNAASILGKISMQ